MNRPFRTYTIYHPRICKYCGITENDWIEDKGFPRLLKHHILYLGIDGIEVIVLICYQCHTTTHGLNTDGDIYDQMAKFSELRKQKLERERLYVKT